MPSTRELDNQSDSRAAYVLTRILFWAPFFLLFGLIIMPPWKAYMKGHQRIQDVDEIYWVGQIYYYHLAFEKRDWSHPDWDLLPAKENPVIGKYLIGLGTALQGGAVRDMDQLAFFYYIIHDAWGEDAYHLDREAVIDRMQPHTKHMLLHCRSIHWDDGDVFVEARNVMVYFGWLGVAGIFLLVRQFGHRVTAMLAASVFMLHPSIVRSYTSVRVDIFACVFILATVALFALMDRAVWERSARPRLWRGVVCACAAVTLALGVGSKLNTALIGILGCCLCVRSLIRYRLFKERNSLDFFWCMTGVLFASAAIFIVSNPATAGSPINGVRDSYVEAQRSLDAQKSLWGDALHNVGERVLSIAELSAFHPLAFWAVALFVAAHLAACIRHRKEPSILAVWWLVSFVGVALWLPYHRPLHVLPVTLANIVLACLAGEWALRAAVSRWIGSVDAVMGRFPFREGFSLPRWRSVAPSSGTVDSGGES